MINWISVAILGGLAIPSGIIGIRSTYEWVVRLAEKSGDPIPDERVISVAAILQNVVLAVLTGIVGFALQDTTSFAMPFVDSVSDGSADGQLLLDQILGVILPTLGVIFIFLGLYYFYYRPRFSDKLIGITEGLRERMGLVGRVFSGGIFEEILFRWGILSIFFWLLAFIIPNLTFVFWLANIISALLFGLAHLPAVKGMGADLNFKTVESALVLNGVVGLLFGWALFTHGLEAAMFAHILLHVVWYPIEKYKGNTRMSLEEAQDQNE